MSFHLGCLLNALFAPPCWGFWQNPFMAHYFFPTTPFPSVFYDANCYIPPAPSIFCGYTPMIQSSPCLYGGGVPMSFVSQFNYQPVSMPQQNWNNIGWSNWGGNQMVQSTVVPANKSTTKTENENKSEEPKTKSNASKPTESSSKVTSADKIDSSKQINLNSNEKTQLVNGTYKADYVNINGTIHYKYEDCKKSELVSSVNGLKLRRDAAKAFNEMKAAAAKEGIKLTCVSGCRPTDYQVNTFKKKFKDANNPTVEEIKSRVKVSAPSGYSEHHTGLAVDINSTSNDFKNTPAYKWLQKHAHEYGFEQSFPAGNAQGLSEESWHYRYVGKNFENDYIFRHAIANDPKMLEKRKKATL